MYDPSTTDPSPIVITDAVERLLPVLDQHDTPLAEALEGELHRARIRVVYPKDADAAAGRVSVLAPIGAALLGLAVGQSIAWRVPGGIRRVRVVEIGYQPEAAGDFHL